MTTTTTLGKGTLNWFRGERICDRYGAIHLESPDGYAAYENAPAGTTGTIVARILQTRPSSHIGDLFRGIGPSASQVGEEIELGTGELFTYREEGGIPVIGVKPADGRETDWMDPRALYRCHNQTVRLEFRAAEDE
jgi:hypothetical protein